jgi:lactoylglutathione lyase
MPIRARLGHLAIRGRDPEALANFYREKLGFAEMFRTHWDDGRLRLIYLRIADDQYLEILPDGGGEAVPPPMHMGVDHFCLAVDSIHDTLATVEAAGIELVRPLATGRDGNLQFWIADPEGNRFEFMEVCAESRQLKAIAEMRQAAAGHA